MQDVGRGEGDSPGSASHKDAGGPGLQSFDIDKGAGPLVRRRKLAAAKGEGLWLVAFSDMSLILMSFFVLQLSYSSIDKKKFDHVTSSMKKVSTAAKAGVENLQTLANKIEQAIKKKRLDETMRVVYDAEGLKIEFKDAVVFPAGSAELTPQFAKLTDQVMQVIASAPGDYRLVFEGHTDDMPVRQGRFQSNWDLSAQRGVSLLNSFKARGVEETRMSIVSYAHTRPRVPTAGLTGAVLAKARAANRRVVIRIE